MLIIVPDNTETLDITHAWGRYHVDILRREEFELPLEETGCPPIQASRREPTPRQAPIDPPAEQDSTPGPAASRPRGRSRFLLPVTAMMLGANLVVIAYNGAANKAASPDARLQPAHHHVEGLDRSPDSPSGLPRLVIPARPQVGPTPEAPHGHNAAFGLE
ncbi:hypothetical protein HLH33_09850 [Gluconacetobacter diazotrophicus]|uniref:Uncharacterized protein n=1 Tax=Gluconacetobacter diazotrophicus TaxID=33996 RepID=A0A7W4FFB1_GLUDI|nr:hypothetical protein [Gluconacetobacter diazotrophicus]MBB2156607.1 hypothetical protein [Gluconacetobacter diazotrophicus]